MNSDPNSDSKQCTKSKLSSAQCTHPWPRLRARYASTAPRPRAQRRVSEPTRSCRGLHRRRIVAVPGRVAGCIATCTGRVTRTRCRVIGPLVTIQTLYRNIGPCHTQCRTRCSTCCIAPTPCRRGLGAVSQPLARCVVRQACSSYHDTMFVS